MSTALTKAELPVTAAEVEAAVLAGDMTPGISAKIEAWAVIGSFIAANKPFHAQLAELQCDLQRADRIMDYCDEMMECEKLSPEDRLAALKCAGGLADAKRKVQQQKTAVLVQMCELQLQVENHTPQNAPPPMKIALAQKG